MKNITYIIRLAVYYITTNDNYQEEFTMDDEQDITQADEKKLQDNENVQQQISDSAEEDETEA